MRKCEKCGKNFKPTQAIYYETECPKCDPPREVKNSNMFVLKGKGLCGKIHKRNGNKKDYSWADDIARQDSLKAGYNY